MNLLIALVLLGAPRAAADIYPIAPVSVVLRVEPDRLVADIDSDSIYWIEEVLDVHPLPASGWSPLTLAKAEAYANARLRLTEDGRALPGRLIRARYEQTLDEVNEQGRVRLRLVYPPLSDGRTLAGEADFFDEYRRELIETRQPILPTMVFRTVVDVPGASPRRLTLEPGAISFAVPVADARRTRVQRALECLRVGAEQALATWEGWPALLALALSLCPAPSPRRAAALALAAAAGALPPFFAPAWLAAAAGAAAAVAAGRWLGAASAPWLEAAALAALARVWTDGAVSWLPRAAPGPAERALAALGTLAAAAAVLAAGAAAVAAERGRLTTISESRAAELFERRRRLAATALGIFCAWGLLRFWITVNT